MIEGITAEEMVGRSQEGMGSRRQVEKLEDDSSRHVSLEQGGRKLQGWSDGKGQNRRGRSECDSKFKTDGLDFVALKRGKSRELMVRRVGGGGGFRRVLEVENRSCGFLQLLRRRK